MSRARVVSVNVGAIGSLHWRGRHYRSAFAKSPRSGSVQVGRLGLTGDRQADLTVHGGVTKAVYAYPVEHLNAWSEELGEVLGPGAFGENLTTSGLLETEVAVGDRLTIGTATLIVTQPRVPCVKMNARFQRADMTRRFVRARRPGFYMRVLEPGRVASGDEITRIAAPGVAVRTVFDLLSGATGDEAALVDVLALPSLGDGARADLEQRLRRLRERPGGQ